MHKETLSKRRALASLGSLGAASFATYLLWGCSTPPPPPPAPVQQNTVVGPPRPAPSQAKDVKAYRADAAKHLYQQYADRIFSGKMPPLLYAIGVVRVELTAKGDINHIDWMRKPTHAPEVIAQIEEAIHKASPFPAPVHLGTVIYTETWLWHKSGRFQLDTLTEGQA